MSLVLSYATAVFDSKEFEIVIVSLETRVAAFNDEQPKAIRLCDVSQRSCSGRSSIPIKCTTAAQPTTNLTEAVVVLDKAKSILHSIPFIRDRN
jgi:hypothetical protein